MFTIAIANLTLELKNPWHKNLFIILYNVQSWFFGAFKIVH